jgi:diacylglycerol kinase (ATP)
MYVFSLNNATLTPQYTAALTPTVQKHIGLFINPLAGKGRALKAAKAVKQRLQAENTAFAAFEKWPGEFPAVTEAWIIGGDGTLNYFINFYKDIPVPLAIFKGGTGNDFAWKLYGNCSLEQQLDIVSAADAKPVDAGLCNDKLYLNSIGIGFDGEVLQSMRAIRLLGGHLGYLWIVIRKIFSFKEYSFTIKLAAETLEGKYLLVAINNSSRTGGGFMVSPKASVTDGLLDMVLCKKLGILKRLRALPLIEKGKHLSLPFVTYQQHAAVTVICEKEVFAQSDGELISGKEFAVTALPGKFLFKY